MFYFPDVDWDKVNPVDFFNNAWETENYNILDKLSVYDRMRGSCFGNKYGSPVWSDIRMWKDLTIDDTFGFNIVGHTQTTGIPVMFETIVDLDCRRCFYLDDKGDIYDYETNVKVEKIKPQQ